MIFSYKSFFVPNFLVTTNIYFSKIDSFPEKAKFFFSISSNYAFSDDVQYISIFCYKEHVKIQGNKECFFKISLYFQSWNICFEAFRRLKSRN